MIKMVYGDTGDREAMMGLKGKVNGWLDRVLIIGQRGGGGRGGMRKEGGRLLNPGAPNPQREDKKDNQQRLLS